MRRSVVAPLALAALLCSAPTGWAVQGDTDTVLVQGSRRQPIAAALDTHGLAWTQGTRVNWACAVCIRP